METGSIGAVRSDLSVTKRQVSGMLEWAVLADVIQWRSSSLVERRSKSQIPLSTPPDSDRTGLPLSKPIPRRQESEAAQTR